MFLFFHKSLEVGEEMVLILSAAFCLAAFAAAAYGVFLFWGFDITQLWFSEFFSEFSWETFKADAQGLHPSALETVYQYRSEMVALVVIMALFLKAVGAFSATNTDYSFRVIVLRVLSALAEGGIFGIILMLFESRFPGAIARLGAPPLIACLVIGVVLLLSKFKISYALLIIYLFTISWAIFTRSSGQAITLSIWPTVYLSALVPLCALGTLQALYRDKSDSELYVMSWLRLYGLASLAAIALLV